MPVLPFLSFPLLVATTTAFLPPSLRRLPATGVALVALGSAAASRVVTPPLSFLLINGALLWSGLLLAATVFLRGRGSTAPWRLAVLGGALAAVLATCAPLWQGRPIISLLAGLGVTAALWLLPMPVVRQVPATNRPAGPPSSMRRWAMPFLLLLLLVPAIRYASIVAGADGLWSTPLADVPFSAAGETLLAAFLLPATLLLGGIWPFGGLAKGALLAPLAGFLLYAIVLPAAPDGVEHWRSLYAGWLLLAGLIAAWGSRWSHLIAAGGLFAIACGNADARAAGLLLTVAACTIEVARTGARGSLLRDAAAFCAAAAAIVALPGTITTEVVYSTLFVLATIVAILRDPADRAPPAMLDTSFG